MNPLFLDTSFIIALQNQSDRYYERAKELQAKRSAERWPLVTTTGVLLELGDGFAGKGRWQVLAPFLAAAAADPLMTIVPVDVALSARAWNLRNARPDKDWGLTDCVSFVVMQERGLDKALTADHHFQQAGFRALLLEP